jgi:hypothetical protein
MRVGPRRNRLPSPARKPMIPPFPTRIKGGFSQAGVRYRSRWGVRGWMATRDAIEPAVQDLASTQLNVTEALAVVNVNEIERQRTVERVVGIDGRRLTVADLPPPNTTRWVIRRKAELLAAVRGGLLSLEEACSRYALSHEEVLSWEQSIARFGLRGLRTTRTQFYREDLARSEAAKEWEVYIFAKSVSSELRACGNSVGAAAIANGNSDDNLFDLVCYPLQGRGKT